MAIPISQISKGYRPISTVSKGLMSLQQAKQNPLTKGISGNGIIQVQPRPAGATPTTLPKIGPQAPQAQATAGQNSATTQGNDGLDSTYFANVAGNQFKTGQSINSLNLQGAADDTALQTALQQLAYQQPRDELRLEQGANNRGALYSSVYDQGLGDLVHSYATRQGAAQTKHDQAVSQIAARIAGLQASIPIYDAQQAADSASRLAAQAQRDPTLGQGTSGLTIPAINPPPAPQGRTNTPAPPVGGSPRAPANQRALQQQQKAQALEAQRASVQQQLARALAARSGRR